MSARRARSRRMTLTRRCGRGKRVDEPDLHNVPPEQVAAAHRFLKRLPARKPTALVIYQGVHGHRLREYRGYHDGRRYPIPWLPLANLPQHLRMARLALGKKKPLIAVIQAFDWRYFPNELRGEQSPVRPPDELRCMTYAALAQRATGVVLFLLRRRSVEDHRASGRLGSLKKVVREVNDRSPLFQAEHVWWPFTHEFRDPATRFSATLERASHRPAEGESKECRCSIRRASWPSTTRRKRSLTA